MSPPWFPGSVSVIDSHTEGEPTRVVVEGWPQPDGDTMSKRRESLRRDFDHLRQAVVCEPRGHDAIVGALLTPPVESGSLAGVIFFNNVGYLGMCGHGLIGVVRTLEHLGRLKPGPARIDTPVGTVTAELNADRSVTIQNVPAYCQARDVSVEVPGVGRLTGDVAWGGNWFYLTHAAGAGPLELANVDALLRLTIHIQRALAAGGVTGDGGAEIDHVELFGPPHGEADSRNFVLCPGAAFDRSPCGTGTSAKMAALHARGELPAGRRWRQESVTGSLFTGWLTEEDGKLIPHINGRAFVTSAATLFFDSRDTFRSGFRVG